MNVRTTKQKGVAVAIAVVVVVGIAYGYQCGWNKVCGSDNIEKIVRGEKAIIAPQGTLYAEIADTPSARERGLSGRTGLDDNEAMLFVFDGPGKYGFWMKDMLFPIDMVWLNSDGMVVHVEADVSPDSYFKHSPPQTFINDAPAQYVLELGAGKAEHYGLFLGAKVKMGQ